MSTIINIIKATATATSAAFKEAIVVEAEKIVKRSNSAAAISVAVAPPKRVMVAEEEEITKRSSSDAAANLITVAFVAIFQTQDGVKCISGGKEVDRRSYALDVIDVVMSECLNHHDPIKRVSSVNEEDSVTLYWPDGRFSRHYYSDEAWWEILD